MVRPGPHDLFLMPGILHCPAGGGVFGEVDDAVKSIARRYASGTPEAERATTQVLRHAGAKGCGKLKGTAAVEIFHTSPEEKDLVRFRFLGDPNKNIYEVPAAGICFPRVRAMKVRLPASGSAAHSRSRITCHLENCRNRRLSISLTQRFG
jgi:hypothetical protein